MYDVIVVGARCAGSPLAMLLARQGYRVLLVDRARFPSDVVSTHGIQQAGTGLLQKWGLLDAVKASNCPPTGTTTIHLGQEKLVPPLDPRLPPENYSPRRIVLDQILLEAAIAAGVEVREQFTLDSLLFEGRRVVGIAGHAQGGAVVEERAKIVVGADGKHSTVARMVQARAYHQHPPLTFAYYSYFSGVGLTDTDLYVRPDTCIFGWPTNDGLCIAGVIHPIARFNEFRRDVEGNFMRALYNTVPEVGERVRSGRREERIMGSADTPNFFREAYGPGWVLAGDAGYTKDPVTALGISDAFRSADALAKAIDDGFSGRKPLEEALARYQQNRDEKSMPLYEFTLKLATFKSDAAVRRLGRGEAREAVLV
jgi:flavin-dependent dehydrogenase